MSASPRTWLWLALGAALLLRLPSLDLPLDRDEGEAATLAWVWGQGLGVPYKDYFELKPPAPIGIHAVAQALADDGVVSLRWISLFYTLATVLGLMLLVLGLARRAHLGERLYEDRALRHEAAAWTGLCAAILLNSSRTQALAAQPEAWQLLPILGAMACLYLPRSLGWRHALAAGLALGLASFYKQTVLLGLALLPLGLPPRQWMRAWLGAGLGALLAWAALAALFASQGALQGVWDCIWAYGFRYTAPAGDGTWRRALGLSLYLLPSLGIFVVLAGAGLLWLKAQGSQWRWLAAWSALALACLMASGRYYPHYAITLLAPLSVAAGCGLAGLGCRYAWLRRGLLLLAALGYLFTEGALWSAPDAASRAQHIYGLSSVGSAPEAARRLQQLCPAGKRLLLWGNDSQLYYLARRAPATRYLYVYMFNGEAPELPGGKDLLLAALNDPAVGAAAVSSGLDLQDPFQRSMQEGLDRHFAGEHGPVPFVVGARKP